MLKWIQKKKNQKGFTLVELVVVIAILGILAGLAVPRFISSRKNAAITAHNANVRMLEGAATMYLAQEGKPEAENGLTWPGSYSEDDENIEDNSEHWGNYLQRWPEIVNGTEHEGGYTVTIKQDGTIEVLPDYMEIP